MRRKRIVCIEAVELMINLAKRNSFSCGYLELAGLGVCLLNTQVEFICVNEYDVEVASPARLQ